MVNEVWWILLALATFVSITLMYYFFGKTGLYAWCAVSVIVANIQVVMTIGLFGLVATLGNIIYGASFLATDVLSELYGRAKAKKGVWIGFLSLITVTGIMWICLQFTPHASDFAYPALNTIFSIMPRIMVGSLAGYLMSQLHDVWAYHKWKGIFDKRNQIWIRNNASTMISQAIDTVVFVTIAFAGVWSWGVFWQVMLTTYVFKWVVAASDTPFIYLIREIKERKY